MADEPVALARALLDGVDLRPDHIVSRDGVEVGDTVEWHSAGVDRRGTVVAVLPPDATLPGRGTYCPRRKAALRMLGLDPTAYVLEPLRAGKAMAYESYIVAVELPGKQKPRLYRPYPHILKRVDET